MDRVTLPPTRHESTPATPRPGATAEAPTGLPHCPITQGPMRDPVVLTTGITYERAAITRWFDACAKRGEPLTCPATGQQVPRTMIPVFVLREQYDEVRLAHPELGLVARELPVAAATDAFAPQPAPAAGAAVRARAEAALQRPATRRTSAQNAPLRPTPSSPYQRLTQEAAALGINVLGLAVDRLHGVDDATRFLRELLEEDSFRQSSNPGRLSRPAWAQQLGLQMMTWAEERGHSGAAGMWRRAVDEVIVASPLSAPGGVYRSLAQEAATSRMQPMYLAATQLRHANDATDFLRGILSDDSYRQRNGGSGLSRPDWAQRLREDMLDWTEDTGLSNEEQLMWRRAVDEVIPAAPPSAPSDASQRLAQGSADSGASAHASALPLHSIIPDAAALFIASQVLEELTSQGHTVNLDGLSPAALAQQIREGLAFRPEQGGSTAQREIRPQVVDQVVLRPQAQGSVYRRLVQEAEDTRTNVRSLAARQLDNIDDVTDFLRGYLTDAINDPRLNPARLGPPALAQEVRVHMRLLIDRAVARDRKAVWRRALDDVIPPGPPPPGQRSTYQRFTHHAGLTGRDVLSLAVEQIQHIDDATEFLRALLADDNFQETSNPDRMSPSAWEQRVRSNLIYGSGRSGTIDHVEMWRRALDEVIPALPPA